MPLTKMCIGQVNVEKLIVSSRKREVSQFNKKFKVGFAGKEANMLHGI